MRKFHHEPRRPTVVPPRCYLDPRTPATTKPLKTNSWNNAGSLRAMIALGLAVFTALLTAPERRAQTPNPNPPPRPATFSLQLNANFFVTAACNGAANPSVCKGWQQFVYSNGFVAPNGDVFDPAAFMQYWLIRYNTTCPAGWFPFNPGGGEIDCFQNRRNAAVGSVQTIANLVNLSPTGPRNSGS